jgi:type IV secretory pathway VirB10-like protein
MPVDERELRLRRVKRQMKAGASIVLAVAAGAFLACQRNVARVIERSPMGPDARSGPHPSAPQDASPAPVVDASAAPDDAPPPPTDTPATDAPTVDARTARDAGTLAVRDASTHHHRPHHVDVDEHRRGLPVIDNLLE